MKIDFTEINGQEVPITNMEFLYKYVNNQGEEVAVFEYNGEKIERKIIKNE